MFKDVLSFLSFLLSLKTSWSLFDYITKFSNLCFKYVSLIYKTYSIFFLRKKVIMTSRFSSEGRLKIGRNLDFQSTIDFAFDFRLRWSHDTILDESKSNEKIWWDIVLSDRTLSHALWMTNRKLYIGVYIFIFHPFN